MLYRLNEAIDAPMIVMVSRSVNGGIEYGRRMQLEPGTLYETDDKVMADSLANFTERKQFTPSLERSLQEHNCKYKVELCRVCGGKKRFIDFYPVEVDYEDS